MLPWRVYRANMVEDGIISTSIASKTSTHSLRSCLLDVGDEIIDFPYPASLLSREREFSRLGVKCIDHYVHLRITCGHFANKILPYFNSIESGLGPGGDILLGHSAVNSNKIYLHSEHDTWVNCAGLLTFAVRGPWLRPESHRTFAISWNDAFT